MGTVPLDAILMEVEKNLVAVWYQESETVLVKATLEGIYLDTRIFETIEDTILDIDQMKEILDMWVIDLDH